MIPEGTVLRSGGEALLPPDGQKVDGLVDYELGGVAIDDTSEGLSGYTWRCRVVGSSVLIGRDGVPEVELFQRSGITDVAFAFSQAMQPHVAWEQGDGLVWMRWFDGTTNEYRIDTFGAGRSPRLCLDDKRPGMIDYSDVILAYVTAGDRIAYRMQRERFGIEHDLGPAGMAGRIVRMGMSARNSLQFVLRSRVA